MTKDTLYYADTNEMATAEDLGIEDAEYDELCRQSAAQKPSDTGIVVSSSGRRVYADV